MLKKLALLGEQNIILGALNHQGKNIIEIIGVTKKEYMQCLAGLIGTEQEWPEKLLEELKINDLEVYTILRKTRLVTQAITILWERIGRNRVSLKEFIQTIIILAAYEKQCDWIKKNYKYQGTIVAS